MAGRIRRRQLEPCIRLAGLGNDLHSLAPGETHHRGVFGEAVHEQRAHAPIAGMQVRPLEERTTHALTAIARQYRNPELGVAIAAGEVCDAEEFQLIIGHGEDRIVPEIDARYILAHRVVAEGRAKTQPPIIGPENQKMAAECGALGARYFSNLDAHGPCSRKDHSSHTLPNASRAAARVASISASPCAAETKPAS